MDEGYNYNVVIQGLDPIPLRTTAKGAKMLMQSFHDEPNMENLLLEAVDSGTPFKNKLVSLSAVTPKNTPVRKAVFKKPTAKARLKTKKRK